jgi:hypothetical protein
MKYSPGRRKREFMRIRQPKDGNCFYHSISFLLKHHDYCIMSHDKIRERVALYFQHKKQMETSRRVRKSQTWAENEEVMAVSNIFNITVKVWEGVNNMWITFGKRKRKMIYLYNPENIHFDALVTCL